MKNYQLLSLVLLLVLCACNSDLPEGEPTEVPDSVEGMRPIYVSAGNINLISSESPRPIENLGKIYYKAPYIFINEQAKGVHVLDNSNPNNPQKVGFITIPGNRDIAIKGNYMYADNFKDLVCIDITDINNVSEVTRTVGLYEFPDQPYPENYNGYFECVDTDKGDVVGWMLTTIYNPQCWR